MILGAVLDAALAAQTACLSIGVPHCVIGGISLQRWGQPRFTADADISVLAPLGDEEKIVQGLLQQLPPRVPDAAEFARRTRVLLLQSVDRIGIDVVLAGLPFESRTIERSSDWKLDDDRSLRTCSAEDLLIMKVFAARDKDWADVTSVLKRQGSAIDLDLVRSELRPLLAAKEQPDLMDELDKRISKHTG